jgi:hypothetical protein
MLNSHPAEDWNILLFLNQLFLEALVGTVCSGMATIYYEIELVYVPIFQSRHN